MKMAMGLLVGLFLISSCGGEKNDAASTADTNTVLAVRTTEDGSITQVAMLNGDFNSPEEAEEAAVNAEWTDVDNFDDGGKLGGVEFVSDSDFEDDEFALARKGHRDEFDDFRERPKRNARKRCGKRNRCDRDDHDYRPRRGKRKKVVHHHYRERYDRRRKYFRIWAGWPQPRYRFPERYPKQTYSCDDDYFWWSSSNGCYRPVSHNHGYELKVGYTLVIRMKIKIRQNRFDDWHDDHDFDDNYHNCNVVLYR